MKLLKNMGWISESGKINMMEIVADITILSVLVVIIVLGYGLIK